MSIPLPWQYDKESVSATIIETSSRLKREHCSTGAEASALVEQDCGTSLISNTNVLLNQSYATSPRFVIGNGDVMANGSLLLIYSFLRRRLHVTAVAVGQMADDNVAAAGIHPNISASLNRQFYVSAVFTTCIICSAKRKRKCFMHNF